MGAFILLLKIKALYLHVESRWKMKYNELHRILKAVGCMELKSQRAGHPLWYSPLTGKTFTTSNHLSQEVKRGTLEAIKRDAGIK